MKEEDRRLKPVDAETKLALSEMKEDIMNSVNQGFADVRKDLNSVVEQHMKNLEKYIIDTTNTRVDSIEKDVERHSKQHEAHFEEISKIKDTIYSNKELIFDKIKETQEQIQEGNKNDGRFTLTIIISVSSVIVAIVAVIATFAV